MFAEKNDFGLMLPECESQRSNLPIIAEGAISPISPASREKAFRALFDANYAFAWRVLRRLGVPENAVDDATQELFVVVARKFEDIAPGAERSFLFGIARRVASDARRAQNRRLQTSPLYDPGDAKPDPEQALVGERTRALLDTVLDAMKEDTREVFILFEFEELSQAEIAKLLGIPEGTAASRLRRAREEFLDIARRLKSRMAFQGGRS